MQRREFSDEFRFEAVKLAKQGEVPVSEIARDLGVHDSVLYRWIRKHDGRINPKVGDGISADERGELARLRRKVKRLETEREILKKPWVSSRRNCDEIPIRPNSPAAVPSKYDVPRAGGIPRRLLRLAEPSGK